MDDLVKHRLDMAEDKLLSSKILLDQGQYKDSIGRSYYAIFSAVRAVLATKRIDFKKHSAVISFFQKEFIKTGEIDVKYSKYVQEAFQIRNNCDYDDFYIAAKDDAVEQYNRAEELLSVIKTYISALDN